MKKFEMYEIHQAKSFAADGGQALHLHCLTQGGHRHFRRHTEAAHLFDQSKERLIATAKRLGVRVLKVEREGTIYQHIDLCGKPLMRAKSECERMDTP